jgi:hypothetical protein
MFDLWELKDLDNALLLCLDECEFSDTLNFEGKSEAERISDLELKISKLIAKS